MTAEMGYIILAELALALFVIWGFLHEERFIKFEAKLGRALRTLFSRKKRAARKLRVIRGRATRRDPDRSAA